MVTRTGYIKHADKSDGVVNIHCVLWSAEDGFDNDPNNSYFSDLGDEGGYNHFELRNYERLYTLPGVFNKGDRNPPMEELQKWIDNGYELDVQN